MSISVCVATYNGEKYIEKQLVSILKQIGKNDECIIQDDCSTDSTVEIIKSIIDPRISLKVNKINVGYQRNFSLAMERAKGDFIFLSDQDDIWKDDKVRVTLNYLECHDAVISDAHVVDDSGNNKGGYFSSYFINTGKKRKVIYSIIKPRYLGCCMAFRKSCVRKILPISNLAISIPHDYYIGTYLFLFFNVKITNNKLIHYRRHDGNVSIGNGKSKNSFLFKVWYRLKTISLLLVSHYEVKFNRNC